MSDIKPYINNFPKYGKNFWCLDKAGNMLVEPSLPSTKACFFKDKTGKLDGTDGWIIQEDFSILYKLNNKWIKLTCKKGYSFDFASIPKFMFSIIGPRDAIDIQVASLFHDLFYTLRIFLFPRDIADAFFKEIIEVYNGTIVKSNACYSAVRIFGIGPWNYQEDKEINKEEKYKEFLIIEEFKK